MARASTIRILAAGCLGLVSGLLAMGQGMAREEIPAEIREYSFSAKLPACDAPDVIAHIQSRFASTERSYWSSEAEIAAVDAIRQVAFRPHGLDLIPRRYCRATAVMADKTRRRLHFAIIEDGGFAGMGDAVQFCLEGYDRNHTAPPGCARLDR